MIVQHVLVDGFSNLTEIGRGGTATVFKAENSSGETVALKILSGVWTDSDRERFERERSAVEAVSGITRAVPLLDSGNLNDGTPYVAVPFFKNGSLQDYITRNGPVQLDEALEIVKQVATILSEVHENHIYHRDVKPGNILLDENNDAWLTDFGTPHLIDGRALSIAAVFTPGYCPPEALATGRKHSNGKKIDIYGLAATLWALLAGHQPFYEPLDGETVDPLMVLNRVNTEPIGVARYGVPENVSNVIATATAKNADDRYESVEEFIEQLENPNPKVLKAPPKASLPARAIPEAATEEVPAAFSKSKVLSMVGIVAACAASVAALVIFSQSKTSSDFELNPEQLAGPTTDDSTNPNLPALTKVEPTPTVDLKKVDTLLEDSVQELMPDGVTVSSQKGIVTLTGIVDDELDIESIVGVASNVEGVKRVESNLFSFERFSTTTETSAQSNSTPPGN